MLRGNDCFLFLNAYARYVVLIFDMVPSSFKNKNQRNWQFSYISLQFFCLINRKGLFVQNFCHKCNFEWMFENFFANYFQSMILFWFYVFWLRIVFCFFCLFVDYFERVSHILLIFSLLRFLTHCIFLLNFLVIEIKPRSCRHCLLLSVLSYLCYKVVFFYAIWQKKIDVLHIFFYFFLF